MIRIKLSTRVRYGIRALLDLAIHSKGDPVPLRNIAERQQISLTYLEHLVNPLTSAGIIRSARGSHGGILLARLPSEINLNEIFQLFEGSTAPVECLNDPELCSRIEFCITRDLWGEIQEAIDRILKSRTLQDLIDQQKCKEQLGQMYYI